MTGFMNQGGINPQLMQLILSRSQQQNQSPQFPQRTPNAPSMGNTSTIQSSGQPQPAGQGGSNPLTGALGMASMANGAKSLMGGGSGSNPWSVPGWLSNMFSSPTQTAGMTPFGTPMDLPTTAGGNMFGGGMDVGGGLGQSSFLTQNPMSVWQGASGAGPDLGGFMAGGGGSVGAPQAGMFFDGAGTMLPTAPSALTGAGAEAGGLFGGGLDGMAGLDFASLFADGGAAFAGADALAGMGGAAAAGETVADLAPLLLLA